jgi:hypothetical protein
MKVISYKQGLDYAVDTAEQTGESVILTGAPMTMRYGANPDYLCSPERMVTPVAIDAHGNVIPLAVSEYHRKP